MDEFFKVDPNAEKSFLGRFDQARRELSALLKRDVYAADIAKKANLTAAAISNHRAKKTTPLRNNIEAIARVFQAAGLARFTADYLEKGEEPKRRKAVVRSDQTDLERMTTGKKRAKRAG